MVDVSSGLTVLSKVDEIGGRGEHEGSKSSCRGNDSNKRGHTQHLSTMFTQKVDRNQLGHLDFKHRTIARKYIYDYVQGCTT